MGDVVRPAQFARVALTGHRAAAFTREQAAWVQRSLAEVASLLKAHGTQVAISGMASGADMWWADAALKVGLSLWAYIPFEGQDARWPEWERERWRALRGRADRVQVMGGSYDVRHFHTRNDAMIHDSNLLIAAHLTDKHTGGTVSTIRKARAIGRPMLRLNATDYETSWYL